MKTPAGSSTGASAGPCDDGQRPRLFALVPCAGSGSRAGTAQPKQYAQLAGRAVVAHTLAALAGVRRLAGTLVVLAPDDTQFERHVDGAFGGVSDAVENGVGGGFRNDRRWAVRCGAASRAGSVGNGLSALRDRGTADSDWVLVHDAARCLLQPAWVDRLIDACADDAVGGLLALPLADTVKRAAEGRVAATVDRAGLWQAQTPQMFRVGLLRDALAAAAAAGVQVTDEASAVEALGFAPLLVPGDPRNIKLTWPADLALAAQWLAASPAGQPA